MDKSEKFWNRSANGYDREEMKDRAVRARIVEKVKKHLKKTDSVLDFGCATGIVAHEITGDVHMVHGIDMSAEMIRIAQQRAAGRNIDNVRYTRSTIFDDGLKTGTFDVILGIYMLHLQDNLPAVLKRIHELLKPGGRFLSVTPCLGKRSLAGIVLSIVSKTGLIPPLRLFNIAEAESALIAAGFEVTETECLKRRGKQYFIAAGESPAATPMPV
ncbi:class I SAM-dependent methyltransferase [Chitinophaga lutea]|uniref:Class I SAM-dependent methyltransferase n=1 Tax=Chitinophaga lutea TaxID=2488634 RepID=A0A3N4PNE2_9BACT|nr:class I SAM-dependent methyltransferase [Chitinophaga lutea]RPE08159.1 class I SAM-dependent methyltransferase [Chitinophaga lutea]